MNNTFGDVAAGVKIGLNVLDGVGMGVYHRHARPDVTGRVGLHAVEGDAAELVSFISKEH